MLDQAGQRLADDAGAHPGGVTALQPRRFSLSPTTAAILCSVLPDFAASLTSVSTPRSAVEAIFAYPYFCVGGLAFNRVKPGENFHRRLTARDRADALGRRIERHDSPDTSLKIHTYSQAAENAPFKPVSIMCCECSGQDYRPPRDPNRHPDRSGR